MTQTVRHKRDQLVTVTLRITEQTVNSPDNHPYDINILPLVETADVVRVGNPPLMEDSIDRTRMVLHI